MAKAKVVVLGGGVGGTFVANKLAKHSDKVDVTVVDATGVHHYQPGLLYVPFGWEQPEKLRHDERKLLKPSAQLIKAVVERIEPDKRQLQLLNDGTINYDYLVIATGSCPIPDEIPGLSEGGHHFYTEPAAVSLREALSKFEGGRIVVGIAGFPYKCPPAPIEFTLLLDDWLRQKNLRDKTEIVFVTPLPQAFSIPTVTPLVEELFARKGIKIETFFNTESVDPQNRKVLSLEGMELDYELLILIPPHKGSPVIIASGLGDKGGWVPTDKFTLQVKGQERIFAIGDATDLPVSKSGAAAHFEAPILAQNLLHLIEGKEPIAKYDGSVMCFVEAGEGKATVLRFNYERPPQPPKPSSWWRWLKALMNRFYPVAVPKGIAPDVFLAMLQGKFAEFQPFCGSDLMKGLTQNKNS
ncbi:MAG: NAD(P)/FAD-dependent oxidoreductase [Armatimonadetes bacterium]|nr:NAD(P)/FAD-dependent oxidoreductase [Armatimonadota bacterium]MDW8027667.1 FAD/NAD(P)-binding oxidoreductase [Armatimonadota bacterium]